MPSADALPFCFAVPSGAGTGNVCHARLKMEAPPPPPSGGGGAGGDAGAGKGGDGEGNEMRRRGQQSMDVFGGTEGQAVVFIAVLMYVIQQLTTWANSNCTC